VRQIGRRHPPREVSMLRMCTVPCPRTVGRRDDRITRPGRVADTLTFARNPVATGWAQPRAA